jgi:negative regulator of sigma E activity
MMIDDELLMAYVDGELGATERATVEAALAQDADLRRRVESQKALRAALQGAFATTLKEPVPEALIAAARGTRGDSVVDLASRRAARAPRTWAMREWIAMAASVVLGVGIGFGVWHRGDTELVTVAANGVVEARGALADALSHQLASAQAPSSAVVIGVSFRDQAGHYCRTFTVHRAANVAGLACEATGKWTLRALAPAGAPSGGGYQMAGSQMPDVILRAVDDSIAGAPLDAAAERAALAKGWHD